jgi:hypothetical protein
LLARRAHQLETGIGDERRAGVADQRNSGAVGETGKQLRARLRGIVVVIGGERGRDAVMVEELAGDAGILAGDEIGRRQHLQRPHGNVAQIADRSGDQVQPGRQRRRHDRLPVQQVAPCGLIARGGAVGGCGSARSHAIHFSGAAAARHRQREKSSCFSFG